MEYFEFSDVWKFRVFNYIFFFKQWHFFSVCLCCRVLKITLKIIGIYSYPINYSQPLKESELDALLFSPCFSHCYMKFVSKIVITIRHDLVFSSPTKWRHNSILLPNESNGKVQLSESLRKFGICVLTRSSILSISLLVSGVDMCPSVFYPLVCVI